MDHTQYERLADFHGAEAVAFVRERYPAALPLLVEGWTLASAIDHVTGQCDRMLCTGQHTDAADADYWAERDAIIAADVDTDGGMHDPATCDPRACDYCLSESLERQAEQQRELARSLARSHAELVAAIRKAERAARAERLDGLGFPTLGANLRALGGAE